MNVFKIIHILISWVYVTASSISPLNINTSVVLSDPKWNEFDSNGDKLKEAL